MSLENKLKLEYTSKEINDKLQDVKQYYPIVYDLLDSYIQDKPHRDFYRDLHAVSELIGEDATEIYKTIYEESNKYKKK